MEHLSSGYQINQAADNAAGLSISTKMRAQIDGLNQASVNAQDGIALLDTADGALHEVHSMLQRIRELAIQASNDTNTEEDRESLNEEVGNLLKEIDRIANETEFNTRKLLNGEAAGSKLNKSTLKNEQDDFASNLTFRFSMDACKEGVSFTIDGMEFQFSEQASLPNQIQIGNTLSETADNLVAAAYEPLIEKYDDLGYFADILCSGVNGNTYDLDVIVYGYPEKLTFAYKDPSSADGLHLQVGANSGQAVEAGLDDLQIEALGIVGLSIEDYEAAQEAIEKSDKAIEKVSTARVKIGSMRNRLEHIISYLDTASENLQETESKIRDAQLDKEMTNYAKNSILAQTSDTLLAQANQFPETVLGLLA